MISKWVDKDKKHFQSLTASASGQVSSNDSLGRYIQKAASKPSNKVFLEVGTWNGLGSTKCFIDILLERSDEYQFFTLESNREKWLVARERYLPDRRIMFLNEVILHHPPSLMRLFRYFPHFPYTLKRLQWVLQRIKGFYVDRTNMSGAKVFFDRPALPKRFDVVFLDGAEHITYFEYRALQSMTTEFILDDVLTDKSKRIRAELGASTKWELMAEDLALRNGWSAYRRLDR